MEGTGTKVIDSHIYFIKLKTHIIGAYGQYNKLKPYYTSNFGPPIRRKRGAIYHRGQGTAILHRQSLPLDRLPGW